MLAVNVSAPFFLIREAFRHMPTDGSASIVNLLSITAKLGTGGPEGAAFPPAPALHGGLRGQQGGPAEPHRQPLPGAGRPPDPRQRRGARVRPDPDDGRGAAEGPLLDQVPMRRFARPEEIADAVAFLVSDQATYITGTSLDVNGGWLTC